MTLKFKGFEIATLEGTGEISAGVGGEASFSFESSIYGKSTFSCSASAAIGIGGGGAMGLEYNMNNMRLAGTAFVYEDVRQFYMREHHHYQADLIVSDKSNRLVYEQTLAAMTALLMKVKQEQLIASSLVDRAMV